MPILAQTVSFKILSVMPAHHYLILGDVAKSSAPRKMLADVIMLMTQAASLKNNYRSVNYGVN